MPEDEIALFNMCTDLVTLKKKEIFPLRLLLSKRPGEWVGVRDFCQQIGVAPAEMSPGLFVTWLPDPLAHEGYAVIMFYDDESKWSLAAHYNQERLMNKDQSSNQMLQPAGALSSSSCSTAQQPAPATES